MQALFEATGAARENAWINSLEQYRRMYSRSIEEPEIFWSELAESFFWYKKWEKVWDCNFDIAKKPIRIDWFLGAKTNLSVNCLDRHLESGRGDQSALIWQGNRPDEQRVLSFRELHREVCRFANGLKTAGVKRGDVVSVYLPTVPELAVAMLACARIGAIHNVVFSGYSAELLADRLVDSACRVLITADGAYRGKKPLPLKQNADKAIEICSKIHNHRVERCIVLRRAGLPVSTRPEIDIWWHELVRELPDRCEPERLDAADPLFILYASGSSDKPKGIQHVVGGYMVYTGVTFKHVFDYHDGDIFWCTADIGWVTGHSYAVYGPLTQGATSVLFEGGANFADPGRICEIIKTLGVTHLYTSPTVIRTLMKQGDEWVDKCDGGSLRILGTVGEPISPSTWRWFREHLGKANCPIVDTWWQTETGGVLIAPLPYAIAQKPGSVALPYFGVEPAILNDQGLELSGPAEGKLAIKRSWPGQMRSVYRDHQRFEESYFRVFPGYYFTGDGARRDADGYYWITGRIDDVITVSGHRLGTAEVESALLAHAAVTEAAVVGYPHDLKGQGICAFVVLKSGIEATNELQKQLILHVMDKVGSFAVLDKIRFTTGLPKTRSGKILRRILRKISSEYSDLAAASESVKGTGVEKPQSD
ncbi:MAG: acetate--CoA ligase [Deltaproteobacteria bacterium]|nr:acetate--CoA ligase [Deltaproteobacteria bacterium]